MDRHPLPVKNGQKYCIVVIIHKDLSRSWLKVQEMLLRLVSLKFLEIHHGPLGFCLLDLAILEPLLLLLKLLLKQLVLMGNEVLLILLAFLLDLLMPGPSACDDVLCFDSLMMLLLLLLVTVFTVVLLVGELVGDVLVLLGQGKSHIGGVGSDGVSVSYDQSVGFGLSLKVLEVKMDEKDIPLLNRPVVVFGDSQQLFMMLESSPMSERGRKMILSPLLSFFTHNLLISLIVDLTDLGPNFQILNNNLIDLQQELIQHLLLKGGVDDHGPDSSRPQNPVINACRDRDSVRTHDVAIRLFSQVEAVFAS